MAQRQRFDYSFAPPGTEVPTGIAVYEERDGREYRVQYVNERGQDVPDPFGESKELILHRMQYYTGFQGFRHFAHVVGITDRDHAEIVLRSVHTKLSNPLSMELACNLGRLGFRDMLLFILFDLEGGLPDIVRLLRCFCALPRAPNECEHKFIEDLVHDIEEDKFERTQNMLACAQARP